MKVAIFTNNFYPRLSGVSVAVRFLDQALKGMGIETFLVAPDYGFGPELQDTKVLRVTSVALTPMKVSMPLPFLDHEEIEEQVEQFAPDLIHVHHPFWLGKAGMDLADKWQVPLVYTFHTLYEFFAHYLLLDTEAVRSAVREYVVRFSDRCDLVIAPTKPIGDYLTDIGAKSRVEAVPTGINFNRFDNVSENELEQKKKEYDLDRFDEVLVYVGRIAKEKNVELLFEALALLADRGHNLAMIVAGDGPEMRSLKKECERLHIDDRVIWAGFMDQDELVKVYLLGDLFLFPSDSDTQGIVLYEARAAGMPLLASDSLASRAIVEPGRNGLFAKQTPAD